MEYTCELCNFRTNRINNLKAHNVTIKHLRREGEIEFEKHQKSKNKNVSNKNMVIYDTCENLNCVQNDSKNDYKQEKYEDTEDIIKQQTSNLEKKPSKIHRCICNKTFSCSQNLCRHKKTCLNVINNLITLDKKEFEEIKQTVKNLETIVLKTPQTTIIQQPPQININMTNNTNSNNNIGNTMNMMSAIKYINENYLNTKPLKMLEPQSAKNLLLAQASDKHSVEEFMVYYYDKNLFHKFIGEIIKDEYKQENPEEQQFWTTDVSRLSFVVRRVMQENESKWIKEPEGKMVKKYIVSPILAEVKKMIDEYHIYCKEKMRINKNTLKLLEMEKLLDSSITCEKISSDIGNQLFDDPVLKYIAPHFKLDL
jgi:hypothetical protein